MKLTKIQKVTKKSENTIYCQKYTKIYIISSNVLDPIFYPMFLTQHFLAIIFQPAFFIQPFRPCVFYPKFLKLSIFDPVFLTQVFLPVFFTEKIPKVPKSNKKSPIFTKCYQKLIKVCKSYQKLKLKKFRIDYRHLRICQIEIMCLND